MDEGSEDDARRVALEAVLDSDVLGDQSRLRQLLTYLVTEEIEGRGDRIKAYTVATEALGRGPGFNPSTNSIVRVEVARLRQALALFAASAGPEVRLLIDIPKGTYRPAFREVPAPEAPPVAPAAPRSEDAPFAPAATRWSWPRRALVASVFVLFGLLVGLTLALRSDLLLALTEDRPRELRVILRPASDDRPVITALLTTQQVLSAYSQIDVEREPAGVEPRGSAWPETYRLTVAPESSGGVRLDLVHVRSGEVLSSRNFDAETVTRPSRDPLLQLSPLQVYVSTLVQREGLIEADYRARDRELPALHCMTLVNDYFAEQTDARHAAALDCIEERIAEGDERSDLYMGLAYMFREEFTDQRNPRPGDPLARALAAANRATQLDPYGGINHYAVATVLNVMRQNDAFLRAARNAVQLNPYSPEIAGGVGARMAQLGHGSEALVYLNRAEEIRPGEANWRTYAFFLAHLQRGETDAAIERARLLVGSSNPLYIAAQVVAHHLEGDEAAAVEAYRTLEEVNGGAPDMAAAYARRNYAPDLIAKLTGPISDVAASI
ncbi:tetratricopeptide repeat protein [Pseudooceanicola sp. LIPI14-2-Ac024]|uniref:tetratricopeptide repeat protein n=1 Tax=Pseudooceanicola sp. LIPI14-2-Ac024 TaxID=3344875 RepID=UPI0035CF98DB